MFKNPGYLPWMAAALSALILAHWRGAHQRQAVTAKMGQRQTLWRLMPDDFFALRRAKSWLQAVGLSLIFISLAGPQWGVELISPTGRTHQVLVAVDVSLSMTAEDVKPTRLEKAKEEFSLLLEQLKGSRVGVMAFAGEAAVLCPLTTDVDAARAVLRVLQPGAVAVPGTAVGKAINAAASALRHYPGTKSLVLLSDGEDLTGRRGTADNPLDAASQAAASGIRIFTVGVGSPEGEPIPLRDEAGNLTGYKKDRKGNTVVSRLDERALTEIARRAGGAYFRLGPAQNEAGEIAELIKKTEAEEGFAQTANIYKNRFMVPLGLAFILLLVEFILPDSRRRGPKKSDSSPSTAKGVPVLLLLALLAAPARGATAESSLRRGNKLYGREEYVPALTEYEIAGRKKPSDARPMFNAGDALYKLEQYDKAAEAFKAVAQSPVAPALRADAYYNLGNINFQNGQLGDAVQNYRKALALNPGDAEALRNLAIALRQQKHPPPQKKNQDKEDKNKPSDRNKESQKNPPASQQPKTRPQDQMSKEDAQRIMRAVSEKEKAAQKQIQKEQPQRPSVEEDW